MEASFKSLHKIESRQVEWLWKPYIPRGCLSIFEGDPDVGKSYLAMHLAAQVTTGGDVPGEELLKPGRVLYVTAEDDPGLTVRPRIEAMGGDLRRVRVLQGLLTFDEDGLALLEEEMERFTADLVIFDTLFSFLPDGVDLGKPSAVRAQLHALEQVFKAYNCAVMLIRHWTKGSKGKAIYRGGGLIDFIGVARTAMAVAKHPENPDQRVLAQVKNNIGRKADSLIFQLECKGDKLPVLKWKGITELTADDLEGAVSTPGKAIDSAEDFLQHLLRSGPIAALKILEQADRRSISKRTLERAKRDLGVRSIKKKEGFFWSLPLNTG